MLTRRCKQSGEIYQSGNPLWASFRRLGRRNGVNVVRYHVGRGIQLIQNIDHMLNEIRHGGFFDFDLALTAARQVGRNGPVSPQLQFGEARVRSARSAIS